MSRVFTDGAEGGHLRFWDSVSGMVISTVQKRVNNGVGGAYSYYYGNTTESVKNLNPGLSEFYLRTGFYNDSLTGTTNFVTLRYILTDIAKLKYDVSTARFLAYVGSTLVGAASISLATLTWGRVEIYYKMADTGGRFAVKLDGVTVIDYTGDTKPGSDIVIDNIKLDSGNGRAMYIDDLALNDTAGASDNSWPGDEYIFAKVMTTDGATLELVPSTGTDHYAMVDEIPPDDDTTYLYSPGGGLVDKLSGGAISLAAGWAISRIWPEVVGRGEAGAEELVLGIETYSSAYECAALALTTGYRRLVGDEYRTNPYTGQPWTESEINAPVVLTIEAV